MSSYGSAHSGHLHPGFQQPPPQQRARSHSNPPYPTTPGAAPYPQQQQSGYFPPPPAAPYQQPATSNPITIPTSNRRRSSDYAYGHGTSPSYAPPASPYSNSYPVQHLPPIPQQQPIPMNYQYSPQPQQTVLSSSPSRPRRRSSSSTYGYNPRQSYESAHSYQSAQSHPSPDMYGRHSQNGYGNHDDRYNYGNENEGAGQVYAEAPPVKGYGDWDKEEVTKYYKNKELEKRPTLGGSLMSLVRKGGKALSGERR